MTGRPAKPLALHLHSGVKHLTKQEIKERAESEVRFGSATITMPAWMRTDRIARAKWNEVIALYKSADTDLASSADVGAIARYCAAWSEYRDLLKQRDAVRLVDFDIRDELKAAEELEVKLGKRPAATLWKKIEFITSIHGLLQIDNAINKKMDQILKLEDRMFLNPLAKIRNIPKPAKKKATDPLTAAGFGDI